MSGELQEDVGEAYRVARNEIEAKLNARIATCDYGSGVTEWAFIAIILKPTIGQDYPEIQKYSKRKKEVEFRLKIDHDTFSKSSARQQRGLVWRALLTSVQLMRHLKIQDCDHEKLFADVENVGKQEQWADV
jgi:hypothetical protein